MSEQRPVHAGMAGTIDVGGDLTVNRLGFGAMRITGPGIWGEPADRDKAKAVLRRAIELGVNFIDTADSYGPHISEELISETLYPWTHRSGPVAGQRLARAPDRGMRGKPTAAQARPDPALPVPPA
jgi:hypothetical protein